MSTAVRRPAPPAVSGPGQARGMRARACVATELRTVHGVRRSCVSTLRSQAPLLLHLTLPSGGSKPWPAFPHDAARVSVAAGAAGPVGGDRFTLHVTVGPGSSLALDDVSATLLLPGPRGERSRTVVQIHVAAGGALRWLPEPLIAAHRCDHLQEVRIDLDPGARLLIRDEVLLGRHGEPSGRIHQRVRVRLGNRPLYQQDLRLGTAAAASPAVADQHRAIGSVLVVDPDLAAADPVACQLSGDAALLPLAGPAALVTALAADNLTLRRQLEAGLAALGPPWSPRPAVPADHHPAPHRAQGGNDA